MSNGDCTQLDRSRVRFTLLDAQDTTSDGVWIEVPGGYPRRTVHTSALESGASVDIMGSNANTKPANNVAGSIIATLTPNQLAANIDSSFRFIRASKTEGGSPAVSTVNLVCDRSGG